MYANWRAAEIPAELAVAVICSWDTMLKRFAFGRRRQSTHTFNVLCLDGTVLSLDLEVSSTAAVSRLTTVSYPQGRSTGADVLERVLEANGVQGEREYFGLISSDDDPYPVRHILDRAQVDKVISLFIPQRWLSLTKPLKKQLTGRSVVYTLMTLC